MGNSLFDFSVGDIVDSLNRSESGFSETVKKLLKGFLPIQSVFCSAFVPLEPGLKTVIYPSSKREDCSIDIFISKIENNEISPSDKPVKIAYCDLNYDACIITFPALGYLILFGKETEIPEKNIKEIIDQLHNLLFALSVSVGREQMMGEISMLHATFDTVDDGIVVVDNNRRVEFANHNFCVIFGLEVFPEKGDNYKTLIKLLSGHLVDPKGFISQTEQLYREKESTSHDIIEKLDGLLFERRTIPRFKNDKVTGKISIFHDVTAQKLAEKNLRILATAVEHAGDAVIVCESTGAIIYVNPSFEKLWGYTKNEVLGKTPRILKSGKQNDNFYADFWRVISGGETWNGTFLNKNRDGGIVKVNTTVSPVVADDGTVSGFVGMQRDITYQSNLEKKVRQTQKMESLGTLAGGIAHDFNNILTSIVGYAEMAGESVADDPVASDDIAQVLKAAGRATSLISHILSFSRTSDKELVPLHPRYIIKETIKLLRASLPSTVRIEQNISKNTYTILADADQLTQVMMNLCTNSAHAMKESGGLLFISLANFEKIDEGLLPAHLPVGSYVCLTIKDSGAGMDEEVLEKIFDPFFTTKKKGEGTGMGLSIVHSIITSLGGVIEIESEPEAGTTFTLFIPKCEKEDNVKKQNDSTTLPVGEEHILCIDDEWAIAELMEKILAKQGYKVQSYTDPNEALELFIKSGDKFDLVITDQTMPQMKGTSVAKEIRATGSKVPIILCTGYSRELSEDDIWESGISTFLQKPISRKGLADSVRKALDRQ